MRKFNNKIIQHLKVNFLSLNFIHSRRNWIFIVNCNLLFKHTTWIQYNKKERKVLSSLNEWKKAQENVTVKNEIRAIWIRREKTFFAFFFKMALLWKWLIVSILSVDELILVENMFLKVECAFIIHTVEFTSHFWNFWPADKGRFYPEYTIGYSALGSAYPEYPNR